VVEAAGGPPSTTVVGESPAGAGCSGATVAETAVAGVVVGVEAGPDDVDAVEAGIGASAIVVGPAEVVIDAAVEVVDDANVDGGSAEPAETSVVGAPAELSFELDEQPLSVATVRISTVVVIQVCLAPINRMPDPRRCRREERADRRCARTALQPAGIVKKPSRNVPRS
jgi:hypothetical protein